MIIFWIISKFNLQSLFSLSKIFFFFFFFFLGDLNYRINTLSRTEILSFIKSAKNESSPHAYSNLLTYDQLSVAKQNRKAFRLFNEENIKFAPTYKFVNGDLHLYNA